MKVIGEFEIHDSFKIPNRGIALAGKVICGEKNISINPGDEISFEYDSDKFMRKIKDFKVGFGRRCSNEVCNSQNLALEIECENDLEIENFEKWKPDMVRAKLISKN